MAGKVYNVLFICHHNSARSLMAEGLLRKWGGGRFNVHSAGREPLPAINPVARELLERVQVDTSRLHPKRWDRYTGPDAPAMDFVFVVCERCAALPQPDWPGRPLVAHWPFPDPVAQAGTEAERRALANLVFGMIERRVKIFAVLPDSRLARLTARELTAIHADEAHASA